MTADEFKTVVDFLIDQKKKGQFRVIWSSLPAGGRPHRQQGGLRHRLLGADGVRGEEQGRRCGLCRSQGGLPPLGDGGLPDQEPEPQPEQTKAAYQLLDFMLGGWYGAKITALRGYMTNTDAPDYAKAHADEFPAGRRPEGRRHHRQCPPEVRARRHLAEPLADPGRRLRSPSGRASRRHDARHRARWPGRSSSGRFSSCPSLSWRYSFSCRWD